jgi:transcriptional regulator with XRE-family HTH domain
METRKQRGRRRGLMLKHRLIAECREARISAGVSQQRLAAELDCSQPEICRRERQEIGDIGLVALSEMVAVLGLELSVGLHPSGQPIRDKGHQALIGRFRAQLSTSWTARAEVPFPAAGDARWWDLVLRLADQLVGVEAETRIRDVQALVRRIRARHAEGGVAHLLLLLSDSRANRGLVDELRVALGGDFGQAPRVLLAALRTGRPVPGSGVVLL